MQEDQPNPQSPNLAAPNPQSLPPLELKRSAAFGRVLKNPVLWLFLVAIAVALPLARSFLQPKVELPPVLYQLPDFNLTDQEGHPTTLKSFQGSVLVANFIFTSCQGACPLLTAQMAKVQSHIAGLSAAIRLVSISVDPENDTPKVLKAYGEKYKADFKTWSFLTGSIGDIKTVVVDGFKLALERSGKSSDASVEFSDITHGEYFVIVDQLGRIRAFKPATNNQEINNIIQTVAIVANTNPNLMSAPVR